MKVKVAQSCLTLCDPMDYTERLSTPVFLPGENSPGKNTGMGCHRTGEKLFVPALRSPPSAYKSAGILIQVQILIE